MGSNKMIKLSELMDKISRLGQNIETTEGSVHALERDLMLKYVLELYEFINELPVNGADKKEKELHIDLKESGKLTSAMDAPSEAHSDRTSLDHSVNSRNLMVSRDEEENQIENISLDINKKIAFINDLFGGDRLEFEYLVKEAKENGNYDKAIAFAKSKQNSDGLNSNETKKTASDFLKFIQQISPAGGMRQAR